VTFDPISRSRHFLKSNIIKRARLKDKVIWNGTMFVDLDWPLKASHRLSASAELLVVHYYASTYLPSFTVSQTVWQAFVSSTVARTVRAIGWVCLCMCACCEQEPCVRFGTPVSINSSKVAWGHASSCFSGHRRQHSVRWSRLNLASLDDRRLSLCRTLYSNR